MQARAWVFAAIGAVSVMLMVGPATAACPTGSVLGRWRHVESDQRWSFFSDNKIDCRACQDWGENGCNYIRDPSDPLGRQQCGFKGRDPASPARITGWVAKDGVLDHLVFSDGTTFSAAGDACRINGREGQMIIKGLGTFECQYNYQCEKLKR